MSDKYDSYKQGLMDALNKDKLDDLTIEELRKLLDRAEECLKEAAPSLEDFLKDLPETPTPYIPPLYPTYPSPYGPTWKDGRLIGFTVTNYGGTEIHH